MKWIFDYFKKIVFKTRCLFNSSLSHILLPIALFLCDILAILGDFSAFFAIPELLPTVITIVVIIYFWRKIKGFPIMIKVNHLLYFFLIWSFTYEWINPFPFPLPGSKN